MTRPYTRRTASRPSEMRDEMRAKPRDDESLARAAARAAQILEHTDLEEADDKFRLPGDIAPDGFEYEWKRISLVGKDDTMNQIHTAQMGWEPVPADRHPEMMQAGYNGPIERLGMALMERPKVVNDRVRENEYRKAVRQVRGREEQLQVAPQGQFEREKNGESLVRVRTSFEAPMAIPE